MNFKKIFNNKKVLITGHTGFKGSWLSLWLNYLGAKIYAISKDVPTNPSMYSTQKDIFSKDYRFNITNFAKLRRVIDDVKPDYVFHLAAQPIVLESYRNPYETYLSNTFGTINILESIRLYNKKCVAVIITSDKCYENINKKINYKESDRLGGSDPYSSSKASAELIVKSYCESFFKKRNSNIRVAAARAGNVIGGGDWADDRIVPDCIKSWSKNEKVIIRNPYSTRPWQHVLEPLGGYLTLACQLAKTSKLTGESFNFGPDSRNSYTVEDLVNELSKGFLNSKWVVKQNKNCTKEANLLSLNCNKAKKQLMWKSRLDFINTVSWTSDWYYKFYNSTRKISYDTSINQIEEYTKLLKE